MCEVKINLSPENYTELVVLIGNSKNCFQYNILDFCTFNVSQISQRFLKLQNRFFSSKHLPLLRYGEY